MTDVVEHDLEPWSPASGRRTALSAAGLLMALGGVALFIQHDSLLAVVAAGVAAAGLVAGAIVLSRAQHEPEAAVAVAWMGAGYASLGALMLALRDGQPFFGTALACAGCGRARSPGWCRSWASARGASSPSRRRWWARSPSRPGWSCAASTSTPRSC